MNNSSYFQSSDFNRATSRATDTGAKIFFKWLNFAIAGTINFVKSAIQMVIGK
jgi:hypothetical protein